MVRLKGFNYEKSSGAYIKQGVKSNRTPRGAVNGGNGTFVMPGTPPQVFFLIDNDGVVFREDFYSIIKKNSNRRVTKRYCFSIFEKLEKKSFASVEELITEVIESCI